MDLSELNELLESRTVQPPYWASALEIGHFRDGLYATRPKGLDVAIALEPSHVDMKRKILPLVVVARFNIPYSIIEKVAEALAPIIAATGVLPRIEPFSTRRLKLMPHDSSAIIRLRKKGVRIYHDRLLEDA
jgi:hypothetical protein